MTLTASDTAPQTLTAEVRTLRVGARQLTPTAARQLDVIPLADLGVWGRVKLGNDRYVIGATGDDILALASPHPAHYRFAAGQLADGIPRCYPPPVAMSWKGRPAIEWRGLTFYVSDAVYRDCSDVHWEPAPSYGYGRRQREPYVPCSVPGSVSAAFDDAVERITVAESAPLIVLGVR